MTVKVFAPAKINLTLHVTGKNDDGYHLLDSLVVFADVGDWIIADRADKFSLSVDGPMAENLPCNEDNLVLAAANLCGGKTAASLQLIKNLPVASGIGGGSTDAAAAMRAMSNLYDLPKCKERRVLALGADVPVCAAGKATRMQGVGEILTDFSLPPIFMVLANSGISMPTHKVFSALEKKDNPPMQLQLPEWSDGVKFYKWLALQRNDLQGPALSLAPEIQKVLDLISVTENCRVSRMSGSGATCFGLYDNADSAGSAMQKIQDQQPDWWVVSAKLWEPVS